MKRKYKMFILLLFLSMCLQNTANAQNVIDLNYWESTSDRVSSWENPPTASVTKLNNHSSFELQDYFNHAKAQWNLAGIYSQQVQTLGTNADIVCYGGYPVELQARTGIFIESSVYGITATTSDIYNSNASFSYNGQTKYHYKLSKAIVCIVDRNISENQFKNIFTHEYGHALGWDGHSQTQYNGAVINVMYAHPTGTTSLSPADKRHLKQFY
jgi:predicted Zn-dependent protease